MISQLTGRTLLSSEPYCPVTHTHTHSDEALVILDAVVEDDGRYYCNLSSPLMEVISSDVIIRVWGEWVWPVGGVQSILPERITMNFLLFTENAQEQMALL